MRLHFFTTATCIVLLFSSSVLAQNGPTYKDLMNDPSINFYDVCDAADTYFESHLKDKGSGWKGYQRWKAENEPHFYPSGERKSVPWNFAAQNFEAFNLANPTNKRSLFSESWKELGPFNANNITSHYSPGIGRVEAFWVNPNNSDHIYLGSRSGGFWKTTDGGTNWVNTTDQLIASGVNAIAVSPTNSDSVWINVRNGGNAYTHGIYFSVNGGDTWVLSDFNPTNLGWGGLGDNERIYKIVHHPTAPNLLFAGTSQGLYRSEDNFQTWTQHVPSGDITDIEFHPTDSSIMYMYDNYYWGNNGNVILRSIDQGVTYTSSATISGNGDARGFISVTPTAPNNVYFASTNGVWKSQNQGATFSFLDTPSESCYGFSVSDLDSLSMIYGYVNIMGSTDGGFNFNTVTDWSSTNPGTDYVHADLRTAECVNGVYYVGTDGYLAKSLDNGTTWTRINDGTSIREFYASGVSQSHYNIYMAGSQDNGTSILNENGWIEWNGGDGMEAIVHTLNKNWMIGSWQYGTRNITKDGGQTRQGAGNPEAGAGNADWQAPLLYDPNNHMKVYHFASKIYASDQFGSNWYEVGDPNVGLIKVAAIAENNSNIMAVSRGASLHITTNQWFTNRLITGLPSGSITDIAFNPKRDSTIIVTYNTYQSDGKKVYISDDLGLTWTNITFNLGDMPIRTVVIDHSDSSFIYLGAEIGIYVKSLSGTQWSLYNSNLPNVTVKDLEIQYGSNTLKAATWGRGLWECSLKGRSDYPSIVKVSISETPTQTYPRAGDDQFVTAVVSYDQNLKSVFMKWSTDTADFDNTITMSNTSDSTWMSNESITNHGLGTKIFFKVFAVGQNNDTTETYKFQYTVRYGQNIDGIVESNFENEIQLYPNPNTGRFSVDLGKKYKNVTLEVFDVLGKKVYEKQGNGKVHQIDLVVSKGNYILSISTDDSKAEINFVID